MYIKNRNFQNWRPCNLSCTLSIALKLKCTFSLVRANRLNLCLKFGIKDKHIFFYKYCLLLLLDTLKLDITAFAKSREKENSIIKVTNNKCGHHQFKNTNFQPTSFSFCHKNLLNFNIISHENLLHVDFRAKKIHIHL